jgi:uncharacterized protein YodC (DUF2158 family)
MQAGDVVQLKSGGPPMTVSFVEANGEVACKWFNDKNKLEQARFQEASLEPVE